MATRNGKGQFVKGGGSGNPAGRPAGTGLLNALRSQIGDELPGIVQRLIREARGGDVQAAKVLLERALPAVKPVDLPVALDLAAATAPGDALRAVLQAVAAGAVTPTQASLIATVIDKIGRQDEVEMLRERVALYEGRPLQIEIIRESAPEFADRITDTDEEH